MLRAHHTAVRWGFDVTSLCIAGCPDVAVRAQQLLEASLLAELQTVVTRALSGMDMFSGTQLGQVLGHEPALPASQAAASVLVCAASALALLLDQYMAVSKPTWLALLCRESRKASAACVLQVANNCKMLPLTCIL